MLADRPREDLGELEDWDVDLGEPVELGKTKRRLADLAVAPGGVGLQILRAAHRLQGWHRNSLMALADQAKVTKIGCLGNRRNPAAYSGEFRGG